jgi:hypothetical protein
MSDYGIAVEDRLWREAEGTVMGVCSRRGRCGGEVVAHDGGPCCDRCGPWRQAPPVGVKKLTRAQRYGYRISDDLSSAQAMLGEMVSSKVPACHSWPLPEMPATRWGVRLWQGERCAVCGLGDSDLVEDHDHETGLVRGWLCRSCNRLEPGSSSAQFKAYRAVPPMAMCGVVELYTGRGWFEGRRL